MNVCYWAEVNLGDKYFSGTFIDFITSVVSDNNPTSLRDNLTRLLQKQINSLIAHGGEKMIPRPSGIKLPLNVSMQFIGFIPIIIDVPKMVVNEWTRIVIPAVLE